MVCRHGTEFTSDNLKAFAEEALAEISNLSQSQKIKIQSDLSRDALGFPVKGIDFSKDFTEDENFDIAVRDVVQRVERFGGSVNDAVGGIIERCWQLTGYSPDEYSLANEVKGIIESSVVLGRGQLKIKIQQGKSDSYPRTLDDIHSIALDVVNEQGVRGTDKDFVYQKVNEIFDENVDEKDQSKTVPLSYDFIYNMLSKEAEKLDSSVKIQSDEKEKPWAYIGYYDEFGYAIVALGKDSQIIDSVYEAGNSQYDSSDILELDDPGVVSIETIAEFCDQTGRELSQRDGVEWVGAHEDNTNFLRESRNVSVSRKSLIASALSSDSLSEISSYIDSLSKEYEEALASQSPRAQVILEQKQYVTDFLVQGSLPQAESEGQKAGYAWLMKYSGEIQSDAGNIIEKSAMPEDTNPDAKLESPETESNPDIGVNPDTGVNPDLKPEEYMGILKGKKLLRKAEKVVMRTRRLWKNITFLQSSLLIFLFSRKKF